MLGRIVSGTFAARRKTTIADGFAKVFPLAL